MSTGTAVMIIGALAVGGVALYYVSKQSAANQGTKQPTGINALFTALGSGFGKGIGDWFGSGYNAQSDPWAMETSWYGAGDAQSSYWV